VLIVALLVLVATILAAIALVRSVDVATLISGNLAFRQTGVQAADAGVEVARKFLMDQDILDLNKDITPSYFSTSDGGVTTAIKVFDPATFDWKNKSSELTKDAAGNTVAYVVHRMCQLPDAAPTDANCFTARSASTGGTSMRIKEPGDFACLDPRTGANLCGAAANPYYRITVKVTGPRSTVSYVQAVIY
jgi:Tfp pilus assembly protein PilX